jgi:hypothetical protein
VVAPVSGAAADVGAVSTEDRLAVSRVGGVLDAFAPSGCVVGASLRAVAAEATAEVAAGLHEAAPVPDAPASVARS